MVRQLAPVRRVTLSGEVAGRLSEAIRSGELPPGARPVFDAIAAGDARLGESAMRDHLMSFVSDMGVSDPSLGDGKTDQSTGNRRE
jgi:DNA-binding FadR family transcriptional regulator